MRLSLPNMVMTQCNSCSASAGTDASVLPCRFLMGTHPRVGANSAAQGLSTHVLQHVGSFLKHRTGRLPDNRFSVDQSLFKQGAVKVVAPPERMITSWIGGSILAMMSTFPRHCIESTSNPDAYPAISGYNDVGPRIVNQMCNQ